MKLKLLFAALAVLLTAPCVHAQDTTPSQLSTEQKKIYLFADHTWAEKVVVVDSSGADTLGTDGTGITQPAGGTGLRGWMSGIYSAVTGKVKVHGSVASGATDADNPVKIGCVYNATQPTVTTGQRVDAQCDTRGNLKVLMCSADAVTCASIIASASSISNAQVGLLTRSEGHIHDGTQWVRQNTITNALTSSGVGVTAVATSPCTTQNITSATTTVVKSGAGMLCAIIVNTPAAGTITVYDNTAASGTKLATITTVASTQPFRLPYDIPFSAGLTIVTSVGMDLTVTSR